MPTEKLTQMVRQQLGLGRLLPLGRAQDGTWIAEEAAVGVLVAAVRDAGPSRVRIDLSDPASASRPAVPPPPSALPYGPLTLTAELAVPAGRSVPETADSVRHTLLTTAERALGLHLAAVDLRVTELLEDASKAAGEGSRAAGRAGSEGSRQEETGHLARAVLAVDGVTRLAPVVGPALSHVAAGPARQAVDVSEGDGERPHLLLQLAVSPTRQVLETARAAREAARGALVADSGEQATVAVLVTAVDHV